MSTDIKSMSDELLKVWHEMKGELAAKSEQIKKMGEETGETKSTLERLNARLDELEVALKRPANGLQAKSREQEQTELKEAFVNALRFGRKSLPQEMQALVKLAPASDTKALSLNDDTLGGYLAPSEFVTTILKNSLVFSPIRGLAAVRQTSNRSIQIPKRTGTFTAAWVGETGTKTETTGLKYGREEIPTYEMYAEVIISTQEIEDAAFNMEEQIMMEASEQFGIAEGKAFLVGTSVNQPEGIMTNADIAYEPGTDASLLKFAGIVAIYHKLKTPYAANATWLLNRKTLGAIRSLVDGSNRPLWDPGNPSGYGLVNPNPATILGAPYVECPDMDDVGANKFPIAFGDWRRAYMIVDRVNMVVQRLVEKYAESGQVAYIVRKRVGGQVVLADAALKLKIATS